jgi:hypothetical protein
MDCPNNAVLLLGLFCPLVPTKSMVGRTPRTFISSFVQVSDCDFPYTTTLESDAITDSEILYSDKYLTLPSDGTLAVHEYLVKMS